MPGSGQSPKLRSCGGTYDFLKTFFELHPDCEGCLVRSMCLDITKEDQLVYVRVNTCCSKFIEHEGETLVWQYRK